MLKAHKYKFSSETQNKITLQSDKLFIKAD